MGKAVEKILIGLAIIVSAGLLIPTALIIGGTTLAYALVAVQVLGVATIINAFVPDFDSPAGARTLAENLSVFASATAVRTVPFGRVGVAGQILFRENITNSGETPDELLLILGLAGYPATSLEKFWFNEELVFDGDSTTGPGAITTGKFANDLWVWFRTGEETSAAFPSIAALSTDWNAKTRILRGIPSIGIRIKITEKVDGKLQPLAQIKGAKLYDPRLDSTVPGGSGAHRFAEPATWEWSQNPKLGELIYLRGADVNGTRIFGMGKAAAAIDLENFAAEANICEEQIDVVGGGTIDRYTLNGLLIPRSNHKANLQRLLSASAGTMDASGGIYRTFAASWRASSMTLTELDIDGIPTEMQLQIDQSKEVNVISGVFAEPSEMWVVKEYPELTDSASIALFGENSKKLDLPFTTDHRIAQRISKIQLKRVNAKRAFNANYWLRAVSLQPGDIVTQTFTRYGITLETFRVDFWAIEAGEDRFSNRRLMVPMRLVEELQAWFDWDETTEEKAINAAGTLPPISQLPRLTEIFYIKPINGTQILNGVGTLTVEAHRIFGGVDELLSTGTIQLYEGTTLITVANGYAAGSDGYTGVLDAGDITGSAIVELKDGAAGTILDSITLVDVADGAAGADGADAIYGSIEPENGLAWTRAPNAGVWTPSQATTDLDCTFFQDGVPVAQIARRITLNTNDGTLTSSTTGHKDGDLNIGRVSVSVIGSGSKAITVQYDYSFGGETATVAETVSTSQAGDDGFASVPSFTPGHIGGQSDFVFKLNEDLGGANPGEIRVDGSIFEHPDGSTIVPDVAAFAIHTVYESTTAGKFYIMFSAVAAETRFGGVAGDWGAGDDTRFITVTWDVTNLWRARNNSGAYFSFTPLATDDIMAVCDKESTTGGSGIESIVPLLSGIPAAFFYIKPITGTAIQNGVGTLTVEAHKVSGGLDILLSAGTIQLYEGSTLVTFANGYVVGSDGYTGILDSGDITGSAIIELKDGAAGAILDSITLVDILDGATGGDGADAVSGFIEPENGLAWTQAVNGGAWTPSQLTSDLDCTFVQGGAPVARIARRVTLTAADGTLAVTSTPHKDTDLNASRVTVSVSGGGSTAVSVQFDYSFGGDTGSVAETVKSAQGGDHGEFFYIKPLAGTVMKNGVGTLTVEAHQVVGLIDTHLSSGTIRLFVGTLEVTVANGFAAGSDGFTGVFDAGDIAEKVIVEIKDGGAGAILNTLALMDIIDLAAVITLSGESISHTSLGTATAGIRFNTDGTVDKLEGSTYTQIDAATDWLRPEGFAPGDYEVRLESNSGDAFDVGPAVGAWVDFSSAREWKQIRATNGTDNNDAVFGIRKGSSGGAEDTGAYDFTAFNDV